MIYEDFLAQFTDWRPTALYWQRFSIAERYGIREINSVYEEIFNESKKDYKLLTELVMVLNHKAWQHSEELMFSTFCDIYTELYNKANQYALDNLKDSELDYFIGVTD